VARGLAPPPPQITRFPLGTSIRPSFYTGLRVNVNSKYDVPVARKTGEFGVRGGTLGPPNPGRVSSALEMKL